MADPIIIGYGQCKWIKDANTKMVYLSTLNEVSSAGGNLETADAGGSLSSYTIPAGKKFILLKFQFELYQSATEHAIEIYERYGGTNYKKVRYSINNSQNMNENTATCETYIEFQAGSSINVATTSGAIQVDCLFLGVETDV